MRPLRLPVENYTARDRVAQLYCLVGGVDFLLCEVTAPSVPKNSYPEPTTKTQRALRQHREFKFIPPPGAGFYLLRAFDQLGGQARAKRAATKKLQPDLQWQPRKFVEAAMQYRGGLNCIRPTMSQSG